MKNIFERAMEWLGFKKANCRHWEKPSEIKGMDPKAVVKINRKTRNAKSK